MKQYHPISRFAIYLLSAVLLALGVYYLVYPSDLFVYVPLWLPGGVLWAYVLGGAFILVGLSFLSNQYVKFTGYLLVVVLLFFILGVHLNNFMNAGEKDQRYFALINILKDLAIAGFAMHVAAGAHHQHFHLEESD